MKWPILFNAALAIARVGRCEQSVIVMNEDPLRDFGVTEPVLTPTDTRNCTVLLTHHLFANLYGSPAIFNYTPPTDCGEPGTWANVVLDFTATSNGTQYDRLSTIYLSNVEIWRTSTPEPTAEGIIWTTLKDVSRYSSLFAGEGLMIVDLGNVVDSTYTGEYDVWLSATFYPSSLEHPQAKTADVILPLSTLSNSSANLFGVPPSGVANVTFPQNAAQAFVEIYASGNGDEEFWYGNVPDEYFDQLPPWSAPDGYASPHGPFREVQLIIDGTLAGVVFPYPVIYTGEFLPSLWRPLVSYGAFSSPTYFIDITPFLGLLSSPLNSTAEAFAGNNSSSTAENVHNFTLAVARMGSGLLINSDWYVSGNIQIVLDESSVPTEGRLLDYSGVPYVEAGVQGAVDGTNISVTTTAGRSLQVVGEVRTGSGRSFQAEWSQNLTFKNTEVYYTTLSNVSVQTVAQTSSGLSQSRHDSTVVVTDSFTYPLNLELQYSAEENSTNQTFYDYIVDLDHSYHRTFDGGPTAGVANTIKTRQLCGGTQSSHAVNVTVRTGNSSQIFEYADANSETYEREVSVSTTTKMVTGFPADNNSTILYDYIGGSLH